jgi:hypothetical protein
MNITSAARSESGLREIADLARGAWPIANDVGLTVGLTPQRAGQQRCRQLIAAGKAS